MNSAVAQAAVDDTSNTQYNEFWSQDTAEAFGHWTYNGIALHRRGERVALRLDPDRAQKHPLNCAAVYDDGGQSRYNAQVGLCAGTDPQPAGSYDNGLNYYNGSSYYFGTMTSPVVTTKQPITTVIASWNAQTPVGTWLEVHIRTLQGSTWTHWYNLPIWASDFSTVQRHSVDGQYDSGGTIATDTYYTTNTRATAYQLNFTFFSTAPDQSLTLSRVTAIADNDGTRFPVVAPDKQVWGHNLAVPQRSQMLPEYQGQGYGGGGEVWCSPTSTSMVMAYWGQVLGRSALNQTVPDAAKGTYDFTYEGTGNWPFNAGYAAEYSLHAFVTRMYSLSQIEQWIKSGVPIVASLAYGTGQLPGSPIPSTNGHLLVIRGFAANGDVITNDPAAATDAQVQITYPRSIFESLWQQTSNGTVYVIYPDHWPIPTAKSLGSW